MKRNEFGEIEKGFSRINLFIVVVAVFAIIITGAMLAKNMSTSGIDNAKAITNQQNV